jgi:hypothetical protein
VVVRFPAIASAALTSTVALEHQDLGSASKFFFVLSSVLFNAAGFGLIGLGAFLMWSVWIVAVSLHMWKRGAPTAT